MRVPYLFFTCTMCQWSALPPALCLPRAQEYADTLSKGKAIVMMALQLLWKSEQLNWEACSGTEEDWDHWTQAVTAIATAKRTPQNLDRMVEEIARAMMWLVRTVREAALFPSWRGQPLEDLLAAMSTCNKLGKKNDHYYPSRNQCRSCLLNLKGRAMGEGNKHGVTTAEALFRVLDRELISMNAVQDIGAGGDGWAKSKKEEEELKREEAECLRRLQSGGSYSSGAPTRAREREREPRPGPPAAPRRLPPHKSGACYTCLRAIAEALDLDEGVSDLADWTKEQVLRVANGLFIMNDPAEAQGEGDASESSATSQRAGATGHGAQSCLRAAAAAVACALCSSAMHCGAALSLRAADDVDGGSRVAGHAGLRVKLCPGETTNRSSEGNDVKPPGAATKVYLRRSPEPPARHGPAYLTLPGPVSQATRSAGSPATSSAPARGAGATPSAPASAAPGSAHAPAPQVFSGEPLDEGPKAVPVKREDRAAAAATPPGIGPQSAPYAPAYWRRDYQPRSCRKGNSLDLGRLLHIPAKAKYNTAKPKKRAPSPPGARAGADPNEPPPKRRRGRQPSS